MFASSVVRVVAHHLAGLADIAEGLFGELQQSNLGTDDLLFGRYGVLQTPKRGASRPSAPRPARLAIRHEVRPHL
jgi:hypothetical protein